MAFRFATREETDTRDKKVAAALKTWLARGDDADMAANRIHQNCGLSIGVRQKGDIDRIIWISGHRNNGKFDKFNCWIDIKTHEFGRGTLAESYGMTEEEAGGKFRADSRPAYRPGG